MNFLFLFLDGVGLGSDNSESNPFMLANMPNLLALLDGKRFISDSIKNGVANSERSTLVGIDACLGVKGLPQSATGQSVLLTGMNIPAILGYHYGPKPNPQVATFLKNGTIFSSLKKNDFQVALLNAYPPAYFHAIESGRRLYSAIPQAVTNAGLQLKTITDLVNGDALAADFTAEGWRTHLHMNDIPHLKPIAAGEKMAELASRHHFSMFEYWLSDYAGHHQDMENAIQLLETFDQVLEGLLASWENEQGLILITSDHGNIEDISTRRHTENLVPALVVGHAESRTRFTKGLQDITQIAPRIEEFCINGS